MTRFNEKTGGLMTRKVTIRLNEPSFLELEQKASEIGTSVSFVIRHLVIRYLESEKRLGLHPRGHSGFLGGE